MDGIDSELNEKEVVQREKANSYNPKEAHKL